MKRKESRIEHPLYNPNENHILDFSSDVDELKKREWRENGLRLISEGKLAIMLNFSGFKEELGLEQVRALHKPQWSLDITLVEFFLHRFKGLSRLAVKNYGKNYPTQREPILVFIQASETQIDAIDNYMLKHDYFGYQGIVCFSTVSSRWFDRFRKWPLI